MHEYFLQAPYCVFTATAKHDNIDGVLGYEMGSGQIFKAGCWVSNTFENLALDSWWHSRKKSLSAGTWPISFGNPFAQLFQ